MSAKGRKPKDLRKTLDGIWWILCTGSMWNQLPSRYGKWNSVWRCYRRWCASGMWNDLLLKLANEFEEVEKLRIVDASHCKCHQDAARSPQSAEDHKFGKTKGGRNTKISAVVNSEGRAVGLLLVPGNQHDSKSARVTLGDIDGAKVLGDKAYDVDELRNQIVAGGGQPNIPPKKNRKNPAPYDKELGKRRSLVENFFCRIKSYRRVATRYDKLAETYMGFVTLSAIADWIRI
ncbi:MAG: IS5 family transposase [Aquiluna sp.]